MPTHQLSLLQTFNAMRIFLDMYFQQHESADIATILGSLQLCMPYGNDPLIAPTIDPAAWHDWINAIKKTLKVYNMQLTPQTIFNPELAYQCIQNYLDLFYKEYYFEDVEIVLILINRAKHTPDDPLWQQWLIAINHAVNNSYPLEVDFLSIDR